MKRTSIWERSIHRIRHAFQWCHAWVGKHELSTLVSVAGIAAGLWFFAELADEVMEQDTESFDTAVLLGLRDRSNPQDPLGSRWFEEIMRDFTALGGIGVLTLVASASIGFLLLQKQTGAALFVACSVSGGVITSMSLKSLFARPRPDLVPHGSIVYSASFPSGHSMMAAATFLTLGGLLARVQPSVRMKAYILMLAMILTFLVGVSRVYLGVHWPTDVLAGWTLGAVWAVFCWLIARWLQRQGKVEAISPDDLA